MNDSENKVFENGGKKVKIIVSVIVALIIAVSSFFIGFFTHKLTRDEYVSSVEWVMSMIEKNVTVLFVSHSLEQVRRVCNKAILLEKGHIIAQGEIEEVAAVYESKLL